MIVGMLLACLVFSPYRYLGFCVLYCLQDLFIQLNFLQARRSHQITTNSTNMLLVVERYC